MLPKIVIGSGPAGVSCAMGLLAAGATVLMVDAGTELEPARVEKLVELQKKPSTEWWGSATAWMREGMQAAVEGIPLKLAYGSDFPYRMAEGAPRIEGEGVNTKFSLGKGGLSVVWGSAAMPYRQHDMTGWPLTAEELAPHYKAVLEFMPVAQQDDGLSKLFPTFMPSEALPLSAQAASLLGRLEKNQAGLEREGVVFGRSRLAVNGKGLGRPGPCQLCGLCMYGCPYELIYSTGMTVEALKGHPRFAYQPGFVVERVEELAGSVKVHARRGGELGVFEGERVFLGAGVLASAAVMLRSLEAYGKALTLRESHYFLLPMLKPGAVKDFSRGNVHTLAQLFLEVMDERLSPYTIHLQTYTYNDLFEQPIAQKLGPGAKVFPWNAFLSRLFLFQGYLHSDHSPVTEATLERGGDQPVLRLRAGERPETKAILKRLVGKLARLNGKTGLLPLQPLMRQGEPGRGFHTGSSFPMSAAPAGFESDLLGRPAGLKRVHVVDSSVLPSVPATTITFTVMANAHRIGVAAAGLDGEAA